MGTMKVWYQDGNTRSQMQMDMPSGGGPSGMPGMGNMVTLHLQSQPDKTFMLDEKNKSYFEMQKRKGREEEQNAEEDYDIKVLGQEKVNGYNCTHIKASRKSGRPDAEMDWWISKEVAGYQEMKDINTRQFNTKSMYKSLAAKGVEGFPVKMITGGRRGEMEMELVKIEKLDMPESRFSLDGFSKKEGNPFMPGGMDPEKLKNMSQEERMKFFQEMQKNMGAPQKGGE